MHKENISYPIDVYLSVLNGQLNKVPHGFWTKDETVPPTVLRYVIEEVNGWKREDICTSFNSSFITKHKLSGVLKHIYNGSVYNMINDAYPNEFMPWELAATPKYFWKDTNNCILATRWLLDKKLQWDITKIKNEFNGNVFKENGFTGLLKWGWNGETFRAINLSYPELKLKPWELKRIPLNNFTREESIEVIRDFIEVKMQWDEEEILTNWRSRNLSSHGVFKFVVTHFNNSMYEAINAVYPDRFKEWEFPVPTSYWNQDKAKHALFWLVTYKLWLSPEEAFHSLTVEDLKENNLMSILSPNCFSCLEEALEETFIETNMSYYI